MSKIKALRITHPDGRMNYGTLAVKSALEHENEILIQNGRSDLKMLLEVVEMTQEELDSAPPINPDFTPVNADTIDALKAEIENLKKSATPSAKK